MANIKIEVVTPVHNRRELTLECLKSLYAANLTGLDLHTIVVDDGSTDGTAEAVAAEFPFVQIEQGDGSLWYTGGMNAGFEAALKHEPDFVLAINNDCRFDPNFLQHLVTTAKGNTRSVVGGVLLNWDEPERVFQVAPKWKLLWGGMRHWVKQTTKTLPDTPWKVDLIVGNCVLFPADAIREAGPMDAERFPQYGDAEYTPRLKRMGWKLLIDPAARIYCKPNDIPARIRSMSAGAFVRSMFGDKHGPHSIQRRFNMSIATAPNKLYGLGAFIIFFVRVLLRMNVEGEWAYRQNEPPLKLLVQKGEFDS